MVVTSRILATLALLAAALVYSTIHLYFPRAGFENTIRLAGLFVWICILSALTGLTLAFLNRRNGRDGRWYVPAAVALAGLALMLAAIYL